MSQPPKCSHAETTTFTSHQSTKARVDESERSMLFSGTQLDELEMSILDAAMSRRNNGNSYLLQVSVAQHLICASPLCFYKDQSSIVLTDLISHCSHTTSYHLSLTRSRHLGTLLVLVI